MSLTPNTEEYLDFSIQIQRSTEAGNVEEQYRLCQQFLIRLDQDPTEQRFWRGFCQDTISSNPYSIEALGANEETGPSGSHEPTRQASVTDSARYAPQAFERHQHASHDVNSSAVRFEFEKASAVAAGENSDFTGPEWGGLGWGNPNDAEESVRNTKIDRMAMGLGSAVEEIDGGTDAIGRIPRYPSHPELDFGSQGDGAGITESPLSRIGSGVGNPVSLKLDLKSKKGKKRLARFLRNFLRRSKVKEERN